MQETLIYRKYFNNCYNRWCLYEWTQTIRDKRDVSLQLPPPTDELSESSQVKPSTLFLFH